MESQPENSEYRNNPRTRFTHVPFLFDAKRSGFLVMRPIFGPAYEIWVLIEWVISLDRRANTDSPDLEQLKSRHLAALNSCACKFDPFHSDGLSHTS